MDRAIITIVNTWTIILAIFVVVTHVAAIFWPRKPLTVPLDPNGLPILWRNETEQKKDVACVWWGEEVQTPAPGNTAASQPAAPALPSFSKAVQPLSDETVTERRSVA